MGFFMDFAAGLATALDKPVEFARKPPDIEPPYAIVYNITESSDEASFDDPHDSRDIVLQVACVGKTPSQVEWMSDKVFEVMVGKTHGEYEHSIVDPEHWKVAWRLSDYRGATLPSGVSWYQQQDNYRIRREAS